MGAKGGTSTSTHRWPSWGNVPWHVSFSTGKSVLPDPKVLAERFFKRKKFRPDPQGTNLMFAFMAQHFTHQFFKTDHQAQAGFTKALGHGVRHEQQSATTRTKSLLNNKTYGSFIICGLWMCLTLLPNVCMLLLLTQVDASNIYGDNLMRQLQLRLHEDGKLKYQVKKYFDILRNTLICCFAESWMRLDRYLTSPTILLAPLIFEMSLFW